MQSEPKFTDAERRSAQAYTLEFAGAMAGYTVVLIAAILIAKRFPSWRIPLALAPTVPLWFALGAALRFFRRADELGRRVQLEAISFAFTAGLMATVTWGMLEAIADFPRLSWTFVPPVFLALYGVGSLTASRRYR